MGHPFKVHVGNFKVYHLTSPQSRGIDQREHDPLFQQLGHGEQLLEFRPVQDNRKLGVPFERGQRDSPLVDAQQPVIIAQSVNHVLKTAARRGFRVACQAGEIFVDLFLVDVFGEGLEMQADYRYTADVVVERALALPAKGNLLFQFLCNGFESGNLFFCPFYDGRACFLSHNCMF